MNDQELAYEIINRLNALIEDPVVKHELRAIIHMRLACNEQLLKHPTLQVEQAADDAPPTLGFLGVLNGLIGTVPDGERRGWGWVSAEFDDDHNLVRFLRTA